MWSIRIGKAGLVRRVRYLDGCDVNTAATRVADDDSVAGNCRLHAQSQRIGRGWWKIEDDRILGNEKRPRVTSVCHYASRAVRAGTMVPNVHVYTVERLYRRTWNGGPERDN